MSETKKTNSILQSVMVVLLVVAAFAVGSMWTELKMLKGQGGTKVQGEQVEQKDNGAEGKTELSGDDWKEIVEGAVASKGEEGAEVTIVEFTDYQCPFCKRYVDQAYGQILSDYVETGKVKYVMRDLPLSFHQNAHLAAEAARCAGEQESYWQYHDVLFDEQAAWSEAEGATLFKGYAGELGLDQVQFNTCLDEGKYKQAVDDDAALARKVGASGTPTFFINGQKLVGAQPMAAFKAIIDGLLE